MSSLTLPVICLMGPTASGKTDLALQLAKELPCEIVSVDSSMVYRDMDIGSAKPDKATLAKFPHHLINIRDPVDSYSAAEFRQDAIGKIDEMHKKQCIPLLVGGTMLYFKALQQGLADLPAANAALREQLWQEGQQLGWPALHKRLAALDVQAAQRIHPNDPQRIQRALEVCLLTGKPLTELFTQNPISLPYQFINIALMPENRTLLHQRIEQRFHMMLKEGFIEEVQQLKQRNDIHAQLPALRAVGYRQIWEYLAGQIDYATMQVKAISATRQLAKRQITWLRSWPKVNYFNSEDLKLVKNVLSLINLSIG